MQVECAHTAKEVWVDPESRDVESMPRPPSNGCKRSSNGFSASAHGPNGSVPSDPAGSKQLSGLHERLDNLESMLRCTLALHNGYRDSHGANPDHSPRRAPCRRPVPPPLDTLGHDANPSVLRSAGDAHSDRGSSGSCSPPHPSPEVKGLIFGPTPQQLEKACPPETCHISLDERDSLRNSL